MLKVSVGRSSKQMQVEVAHLLPLVSELANLILPIITI